MNEPLLPCPFEGCKVYTIFGKDGYRVWGCPHANGMRVEQWQTRTPPPAAMKFPDKKEYQSKLGSQEYAHLDQAMIIGWNKCLKACKELNAPNVEQSGYFTENPKFSSNAEKRRYEMQKTKLTYCKHKILEPHCDECFPTSEDYCAETVMVPDNTSEVEKLAALIRGVVYTDGWVPDVIANEIINSGWKKEGKDG